MTKLRLSEAHHSACPLTPPNFSGEKGKKTRGIKRGISYQQSYAVCKSLNERLVIELVVSV